MDITVPYLRGQDKLLAEIKVLVRDPDTDRWSDAEYYAALNQALMTWGDKVKFPRVYTISGGWQADTYEYALANYMRPPYYPELKRRVPYTEFEVESSTERWQDVPGWEVVSDGSGGQVLRLYAPPRSVEGQVTYYAPNSRVPTTIPTTSSSTSSTATSLTLGSAIDIDDVGYILCEAEWISYAGVTRAAATTTLNNLVHGLNGTTAATHNSGSNVYWGVAADDLRLYKLLMDQWRSYLHAYYLQDGGTHETSRHEKAMGFYEQLATNFWAEYHPHRRASNISLNRKVFMFR